MPVTQHAVDLWPWIDWGFILLVLFGGSAGEAYRRFLKRRRKAAEIRHRRQVELVLARSGQLPRGLKYKIVAEPARTHTALPAAVIASPPGAEPVRGVPGACRHERIIPVITDDGELVRWVCANHQRCEAEFPPSTALYEPAGES